MHTVEVVDTSGGLFGETLDAFQELWVLVVNEGGEVTTVVENQVQGLAAGEALDGLVNTPGVFLLGFTLPGEDGDAGDSDGGGGMVLGGEDVLEGGVRIQTQRPAREQKTYARRPGNLGAESGESLDQDGGLNGHVQASSDTSALERFGSGVLLPHVHKTWHLMLGDFDLLATKGSEGDVCVREAMIRGQIIRDVVGNSIPATLKTMIRLFFWGGGGGGEDKKGNEEKKRERGGTRFLLRFLPGDPSLFPPSRLLVPIRSGSLTDVLTCPRRTGLDRWVQAGRNPSVHLPFRRGGWCSQIHVLSHSEDLQNVRGL